MSETGMPPGVHPTRRAVDEAASRRANRVDWDAYSEEYQATHGDFLGDVGFVWGPEGTREAEVKALGDPRGKACLEVGSGAGQCARWLASNGAFSVGMDLSLRQLVHGLAIDSRSGVSVPVVNATGTHLPFADDSFDLAFSAFGALQFVADIDQALSEIARVLRPGGRLAFSITHPIRWAMPDDPGEPGLVVANDYWDRTPYVEETDDGQARYVEHHRTLGDWVSLLADTGFVINRLIEPQWPEGHERIWGGWGPIRGRLIPGTALFVADTR